MLISSATLFFPFPKPLRWILRTFQKKIFKFLALLKLAVIVILDLAYVLALGTIYESQYGTPVVKEILVPGNNSFFIPEEKPGANSPEAGKWKHDC